MSKLRLYISETKSVVFLAFLTPVTHNRSVTKKKWKKYVCVRRFSREGALKVNTVQPRFNEPLYNAVLGTTNDILQPGQSYSQM